MWASICPPPPGCMCGCGHAYRHVPVLGACMRGCAQACASAAMSLTMPSSSMGKQLMEDKLEQSLRQQTCSCDLKGAPTSAISMLASLSMISAIYSAVGYRAMCGASCKGRAGHGFLCICEDLGARLCAGCRGSRVLCVTHRLACTYMYSGLVFT